MDHLQKTLAGLPHAPGVYLYSDVHGTILYVGKAKDLYKRVHQYFATPDRLPYKTRQLVPQIHTIRIREVATEFDALLLEAKLIRYYTPKYNSIAKDDKSPIYISYSLKDRLPIVCLSRKPKYEEGCSVYFGPFPSTRIARNLLKTLRHSIPFCQQKIRRGKPCFYTHLGLCSPCPSDIVAIENDGIRRNEERRYRKNIKHLTLILSGKLKQVLHDMDKEMAQLSKNERFEEAGIIKMQRDALMTSISTRYDPFVFEQTDALEKTPEEAMMKLREILLPWYPHLKLPARIECYDMSTQGGSSSVGSMTVLLDGIPYTNEYRRFRIRRTGPPSDVAMMEEVLMRRFKHSEWQFPDLIIVDGGVPQVHVAKKTLETIGIDIPIIGLAKRMETIICINRHLFHHIQLPLTSPALHLIEHIRDEAHRFAITYHRKLMGKSFHTPGMWRK